LIKRCFGVHFRSALTSAFAVSMSFLMTATIADIYTAAFRCRCGGQKQRTNRRERAMPIEMTYALADSAQ
jgi:hypothetical protein